MEFFIILNDLLIINFVYDACLGVCMKNIIKLNILFIMLFVSVQACSAATCPTADEVKAKMRSFQMQAIKNMNNNNASSSDALKLLEEQEKYNKNMFYGCVEYFKTAANPDCSRFSTLSTGYMLLGNSEKGNAKTQLDTLINRLNNKCPNETNTLELLMK